MEDDSRTSGSTLRRRRRHRRGGRFIVTGTEQTDTGTVCGDQFSDPPNRNHVVLLPTVSYKIRGGVVDKAVIPSSGRKTTMLLVFLVVSYRPQMMDGVATSFFCWFGR